MEPSGQATVAIRTTLIETGHLQPPTSIQVDNFTAVEITNKSTKQKISKAMDICFHWIQDIIIQCQFCVFWKPTPITLGNYYFKHHSVAEEAIECRDWDAVK